MKNEQTKQAEISGYLSTLLRNHFGKGPTAVYVTIQPPFLTIHLRGFLAPMEKLLVKQKEFNQVLKTRDLLMNDLRKEIIEELRIKADLDIMEMYADWNLEKETGLLIGVLNTNETEEAMEWPNGVSHEEFKRRIERASYNEEKVPDRTDLYWLNDRTVLVKRSGILVAIEKELIRNGFEEELLLAKRPLEHRVLEEVDLEAVLHRKITETFLNWNFETDISYVVFLLEPQK